MSIKLYSGFYYNNLVLEVHDTNLNVSIPVNPKRTIESIENDSDYYFICSFDKGSIFSSDDTYCVPPQQRDPILPCNFNALARYRLQKQYNECTSNRAKLLVGLTIQRRETLTKAIENVHSNQSIYNDYRLLNEGFIVLYSQPNYTGIINFIKAKDYISNKKHTFFRDGSTIKVGSFINMTDEYVILSNSLLINSRRYVNMYMYIESREIQSDTSLIYKSHEMKWFEKVNDLFFKRSITLNTKFNVRDPTPSYLNSMVQESVSQLQT